MGRTAAIGTIKMFHGTWHDNYTEKGWYACTAANAAHGVPDLKDKFVMGADQSGGTGGANSRTLTGQNMPQHAHVTDDHHHYISLKTVEDEESQHKHYIRVKDGVGTKAGAAYALLRTEGPLEGTENNEGEHRHNIAGYTNDDGGGTTSFVGSGTAFDNRPAYVGLIFIMKCYHDKEASDWATANPVLAQGEWGMESDTGKVKHGDGVRAWNSLDYGAPQGATGQDGLVDPTCPVRISESGGEIRRME